MKGHIYALFCALALAKAERVRLNRNGCSIDVVGPNALQVCDRQQLVTSVVYDDPKQAPLICTTPASDGILVAHEHCNQFYQCWDGVPLALNCYGNLHYNPILEICDWPQDVDCGVRIIPEDCDDDILENKPDEAPVICSSEGSEDILISHKDCDKFQKCHNREPVTLKCPGHLLYNPVVGYCDCAENVICGDRVIPDKDKDNDKDENNNGNTNPDEAPTICAAEESEGVLVAHENCNKFYKCAQGKPVEFKCYGNLLFDAASGHCDWPENVECGDRVISEVNSAEDNDSDGGSSSGENGDDGSDESGNGDSNESENGDNGNGDNGNGGTCNCNPGEAPQICSSEGSEGTLVAHENCNQFYTCLNRIPVSLTCPSGLMYNSFKAECDWPDNVECGDRIIPETDSDGDNSGNGDWDNGGDGDEGNSENENGESGIGDNGNGDNGNGGTCNCNPGEAPQICSAKGSEGTLVAHENCNQFYTCLNGIPVSLSCPSGLMYNPFKAECDWPHNVECGDRIIPDTDPDGGNSGNGDSDNGGDGDEGNSENGNGESGNGDNGESGNGDNGNGDNGNGGTCNCNPGEAPQICSAEGSEGTLVAHENCNQFYTCLNGIPVSLTCPSGLMYNPFKAECDWPDNVECGDRIIPETDSDGDNSGNGDSDNGGDGDEGNSENGNGESGNGDNGNGDNGNGGTCNCNPGEAPQICSSEGSEGTLVAHENCNQFYTCLNGIPVSVTCPSGLMYNPFKAVCDWPENVECGERIIPENDCDEENSGNGDSDNGGDGDEGNSENGNGESGNGDNGESGNGDNGNGDNGNGGTCNCNPGEAPQICSAEGSEGTLVAHENCNQFYTCLNGIPLSLTCPSGLMYNPFKAECDWPDNVECGERIIPETDCDENNSGNGDSDNDGDGDEGNSENGNGESGNGDNGESGNGDNGNGDNGNGGICNCNPGEAPRICSSEGSEGTLVAHENCNQFYTCLNGIPVSVTCPSGLMYNPFKAVCDWPENVECGERIIPETDCDEENSGNGDSDNGGDGNEGNSENGNGESGNGDNGESGNGDNNNGNNGNGGTCNCNPGEAPQICSAEGSEGTLVAHENCNQFYTCLNGIPVSLTCPSGLMYNAFKAECDWPDKVECGERIIPETDCDGDNHVDGDSDNGGDSNEENSEDGNDNTNGSNGDNGNESCNCNPSEAPTICAADGTEGTLVAHENCNQFYTCLGGKPVTQNCPSGLLFNPYKDECDWPDNVICGARVIPEDDCEDDSKGDNENGNADNDNDKYEENENGNFEDISHITAICSADDSEGVFVSHTECNKFYTCRGGAPVTIECVHGLMYDPINKQCDWPENVKCDGRTISGAEVKPDNDNGQEKDEIENKEEVLSAYDKAVKVCAEDGSSSTIVPHEDCNRFYVCVQNIPTLLQCASDLLYDISRTQCNWRQNVDCGDRRVTTSTSSSLNKHLEGRNALKKIM